VTTEPEHPYTQRLLLEAPIADPVVQQMHRSQRTRLREAQWQDEPTAARAISCAVQPNPAVKLRNFQYHRDFNAVVARSRRIHSVQRNNSPTFRI
jgi:hypothetical protein